MLKKKKKTGIDTYAITNKYILFFFSNRIKWKQIFGPGRFRIKIGFTVTIQERLGVVFDFSTGKLTPTDPTPTRCTSSVLNLVRVGQYTFFFFLIQHET